MEANEFLNISRVPLNGDFDNQVQQLLQHVRLSKSEVEGLQLLFDDLQGALQRLWRGCEVQPFGSIVTGLGIKSSDVDCFIRIPAKMVVDDSTPPPADSYVKQAKAILSKNGNIFKKIFAIGAASVPIVTFYHAPTARHCDVSFKSPAAVCNSFLITHLLHMDERVLPLAVLTKYWSKVHNLTGTHLMPNYCLTLLIIFYLQQKTILPPVSFLQRNITEYFIDEWNVAFESVYHVTSNTDSLYDLLGGFFKFYSSFNFQKFVISIFVGQPIDRELFSEVDSVPEDFGLYKHHVERGVCKPLKIDTMMCVQDSFVHNKNCAVPVHPKLANTVILHFKKAAQIYENASEDNFLKKVLVKSKPESTSRPARGRGVTKLYRDYNKLRRGQALRRLGGNARPGQP